MTPEAKRINKYLGRMIAKERRAQGLTQGGLGDLVGLTRDMIANIENGRCGVLVWQLLAFEEHLGIELTTFGKELRK